MAGCPLEADFRVAARTREFREDVFRRQKRAVWRPNALKRGGYGGVLVAEQARGASVDYVCDREHRFWLYARRTVDFASKQFSRESSALREVGADAGKGRGCVLADGFVVVDADDCDVVWDGNIGRVADEKHRFGQLVVGRHDSARLVQGEKPFLQLLRLDPVFSSPRREVESRGGASVCLDCSAERLFAAFAPYFFAIRFFLLWDYGIILVYINKEI